MHERMSESFELKGNLFSSRKNLMVGLITHTNKGDLIIFLNARKSGLETERKQKWRRRAQLRKDEEIPSESKCPMFQIV